MNILKTIVIIGLICGLLFLAGLDVKAEKRLTKEESVAAGKALFKSKSCSHCHSLRNIKDSIGSNLLRWKNIESPMLWAAIMWNHAPKMAIALDDEAVEYPTFEDDEFANIVAYINSFTDEPGRYKCKPDENKGKFLFQYLGCAECHSIRGKGGSVGPDLAYVTETINNDYVFVGMLLSHAVVMSKTANTRKVPWPRMQGDEVAHIFAYFKSVIDENF